MREEITEFSGKYSFLSNFYPSRIEFDGIRFPTAEHAYQAQKSLRDDVRARIAERPTPGQAKREGRKIKIRDDWNDVRVDVMAKILRVKFSDPDLKEKLLATGDAELIEGNYWGDTFWGVCNGVGANWLGHLLMEVRTELSYKPNPIFYKT